VLSRPPGHGYPVSPDPIYSPPRRLRGVRERPEVGQVVGPPYPELRARVEALLPRADVRRRPARLPANAAGRAEGHADVVVAAVQCQLRLSAGVRNLFPANGDDAGDTDASAHYRALRLLGVSA
jgi:hypothetical protein